MFLHNPYTKIYTCSKETIGIGEAPSNDNYADKAGKDARKTNETNR